MALAVITPAIAAGQFAQQTVALVNNTQAQALRIMEALEKGADVRPQGGSPNAPAVHVTAEQLREALGPENVATITTLVQAIELAFATDRGGAQPEA
jgi:hypothetical protein